MRAFRPLRNPPKIASPSAEVRPFLAWVRGSVLIGIVGVALAGAVTAWVRGAFDEILRAALPTVPDIACELREAAQERWPQARTAPRPADKLTILIATLRSDDAARSNTHAVELAFQGQDSIERIETCRVLSIEGVGGGAERQAIEKGRAWLAQRRADLLIWGEVLEEKKGVDLHFIAPVAVSSAESSLKPSPFRLEINLLNEDFAKVAAAQLTAAALAAIKPATAQQGRFLVDILRPAAARLKHLAEDPPPGFSAAQRADIQRALGIALSMTGYQSGESGELLDAVAAFREALKGRPRERDPLGWAAIQNNLGLALVTLGQRESGTARFEEAVQAYREALKERTRERVPLNWAETQNNLGHALWRLGERESGTDRLEEAVQAYCEALKEQTRERVPLDWAMTQNNLGVTLLTLGEREGGTARLDEVARAFREALKERTRERVPLQWATTQSNFALALKRLGERESGTARLEEAVQTYHEALKEQTRERVPLQWANTQNNLGNALLTLSERESGTARLKEAVQAYREALQERTRERVPLQWATTQRNLGKALKRLGEQQVERNRSQGCAVLEEARAAYARALEVPAGGRSKARRNIEAVTQDMDRLGCGG